VKTSTEDFESALAELQDAEDEILHAHEENFKKWYMQFIADEAAGRKAWPPIVKTGYRLDALGLHGP
jgi:cellobiose-specific phosphotransferase system component IIA